MGKQTGDEEAALLRLREGESLQEHIWKMIGHFKELAVIGDPVNEEYHVFHKLASLPESYNTLVVSALEASPDAPQMEVVTVRKKK